jgi:hypothetical protein
LKFKSIYTILERIVIRKDDMFKAVTKYAGKFKSLFEVIFQNVTTAHFTIDEKGMFLEQLTTQNLLISIFLPAENFEEYVFQNPEPIHVGLGHHINKEFFKSIKNKDVITMSITKPYIFDFEKTTDFSVQSLAVSMEDIQNIIPMHQELYGVEAVKITNADFNQMCRSFNANTINVIKTNGQIQISFDTGRSVKTFKLGKENKSDSDLVHQMYSTEQFTRVSKISSFSKDIKVFLENDRPLHFLCESAIGTMKLFIFPKPEDS